MRVGILTFHRAVNYGALLQAFALQRTLYGIGVESQIIDYRNQIIEDMYRFKSFFERRTIKSKIKYFIQGKNDIACIQKFEKFRDDRLNLTSDIYYNAHDLKKIEDSFDLYITGSDQVWNYNAHGFDENYFLDFVINHKKRFSYAASFGITSIPEIYQRRYKLLLSCMQVRSIREEEGKILVKDIFGMDSRVDLDPTLLMTKRQWIEQVGYRNSEEKYILVYCFGLTDTMKEFVEKLSKASDLKVRFFGKAFQNPFKVNSSNIVNADPFDFVREFLNAEYIVTNSFHGTAFSINLNKKFFVELLAESSKVNSRIENIIRFTDLESRYINSKKPIERYMEDRVNWERVNEVLNTRREESISFLREILVPK